MKKKKAVSLLSLVIVFLILAAGYGYWHWYVRPLALTVRTTLMVRPGEPLTTTASALVKKGVLYHSRDLIWLARLRQQADSIRAGEYEITPGETTASLLDTLVDGRVVLHRFTVIDGWTFSQLIKKIEANPLFDHTLKGLSASQVMTRLGHPGQRAEGRFYPDTYKFPRGTSDVAFLKRAYRLMHHYLDIEWQHRDKKRALPTPYKSLILASVIEKESGDDAELPRIAGVFMRRLRKHMRLQSDPTVIYGMGDAYNGNITYRDLRTDTPYNTYTRFGLPPTPIALPSRAAIHAAMHPANGKALYFVSKGDGTHQFSATLVEHNRAVRRYQLNKGH